MEVTVPSTQTHMQADLFERPPQDVKRPPLSTPSPFVQRSPLSPSPRKRLYMTAALHMRESADSRSEQLIATTQDAVNPSPWNGASASNAGGQEAPPAAPAPNDELGSLERLHALHTLLLEGAQELESPQKSEQSCRHAGAEELQDGHKSSPLQIEERFALACALVSQSISSIGKILAAETHTTLTCQSPPSPAQQAEGKGQKKEGPLSKSATPLGLVGEMLGKPRAVLQPEALRLAYLEARSAYSLSLSHTHTLSLSLTHTNMQLTQ
jgi:hypothetical protein